VGRRCGELEENKDRVGKCEIKSLGGREDVRTVSSWEKLHGVRPGKKKM